MPELSLLQWNVWYHEKAENIIELLSQTKADIVCCQELTVNSSDNPGVDVPKKIAEVLGYEYYFVPTIIGGIEDESLTMGNAIFSRFPITAKRSVFVQEADELNKSYDSENRTYVEVSLQIEGKNLTIGTVHLSYSHAFDMTEKRLYEANELMNAISTNNENFILTGDMNATPSSPIIKQLTDKLNNMGPGSNQPTWTSKPFSYQGFEANTLNWRLDYGFATPDIKIKSAEIIKTSYSDHLPILWEITI